MSHPTQQFFLPYQKRWIEDKSPLKIMEKSRQIGMSWSASYALVREHAAGECAYDTWVSSRDELQAELFITDCANFANILDDGAATLSRRVLDGGNATSRALTFSSGKRIHALSSNPNAQAGKRGTRLLDEFALHPDPEELYAIALPGITWGGRLEIISTHRGSHNFFNRLISEITQGDNPKNFSYHRVTLVDALTEGFLDKLKSKLPADDPRQAMCEDDYLAHIRSQCPDEATFQQEYMCNPAQDNSTFLPADLILAATSTAGAPADITGELYIGADLGRTHDFSVFWVLEKIADHFFTRDIIVLRDTAFSAQESILADWLAHPHLAHATIDASGLGRQFAETMVQKFGPSKITALVFTESSKTSLAYHVLSALERHTLSIPADAAIQADLLSIRRTYTPSGNLTFAAKSSANGHGDRFWALAMALSSAATRTAPTPAKPAATFTPLTRTSAPTRTHSRTLL